VAHWLEGKRNPFPVKRLMEWLTVLGGRPLIPATGYLEMARECMVLSVEAGTAERRTVLISMAKLSTQTRLAIAGAGDVAGQCRSGARYGVR